MYLIQTSPDEQEFSFKMASTTNIRSNKGWTSTQLNAEIANYHCNHSALLQQITAVHAVPFLLLRQTLWPTTKDPVVESVAILINTPFEPIFAVGGSRCDSQLCNCVIVQNLLKIEDL